MKKLLVLAVVVAMAMGAMADLTFGINGAEQVGLADYAKAYLMTDSQFAEWQGQAEKLADPSAYTYVMDLAWGGMEQGNVGVKWTSEDMYDFFKNNEMKNLHVVIAGSKDYYAWTLDQNQGYRLVSSFEQKPMKERAGVDIPDIVEITSIQNVGSMTATEYAVPEPTSGLLLLLGVAGLALKRKRA